MSALSAHELARLKRFLSAHEQRFALALVRISQIPLRSEFSAQIQQWCKEHDRRYLHFKLAGLKPDEVWDRIRSGIPVGTVGVFGDLDAAFHEPTGELASLLNRQRERIAELLPGPVLLVLGEGAMNRLFIDAPDLADWHAATFEFESTPLAARPRAEESQLPERSAEWIESRIALLQDQLDGRVPDRSRARVLMELADLYRDSLYAVSSNPEGHRSRSAFEGVQLAEADLREAVDLQRRLAERERDSLAQRNLGRALDALAQLLQESGRYAEAEPLFAEGLRICKLVLGEEDPETLTLMNNLAQLYDDQGRYSEAEPLYLQTLGAKERLLGAEHPSTLTSANNLAILYASEGRYAEAEPLYLRTLAASERALGGKHPSTLTMMSNLAGLYEEQGRYAEAEPLHLRALATKERMLGADHPDTLKSVNNIALLYARQGRFAEAEPLHLRDLAASERVLGTEHPDTLKSVNNLAWLYKDQARYAEAEPLYQRALAGGERVLGSQHPFTLATVNNLAMLYSQQGRYAEAEPLFLRALAAQESVLGTEHPNTLSTVGNLAALYHDQGRYAEAEQLYQRAATTAETVLGHDHPDTKLYRKNLEHLRSTLLTARSSRSSPETTPDLC